MNTTKFIFGKVISTIDLKTKKVRCAFKIKKRLSPYKFKFKTVLAHDRLMNTRVGDIVLLSKTRKLSKNKFFLIENF